MCCSLFGVVGRRVLCVACWLSYDIVCHVSVVARCVMLVFRCLRCVVCCLRCVVSCL